MSSLLSKKSSSKDLCCGKLKDGRPCTFKAKQVIKGVGYCDRHKAQSGKEEVEKKDVKEKTSEVLPLSLLSAPKPSLLVASNVGSEVKASSAGSRRPVKVLTPYPWQEELIKFCGSECLDDRTVSWIYDEAGGTGKSTVQSWITEKHGKAKVFSLNEFGKEGDLAENIYRALKGEWKGDVCLINLTRAYKDNIMIYDAIEKIKDGKFTRLKYAGGEFEIPCLTHVLVFSNFLPNLKEISNDRLRIYQVGKGTELKAVDVHDLKIAEGLSKLSIT